MCKIKYRPYNPDTDWAAVKRIWLDVGWIEKGHTKPLKIFLKNCRALVADFYGRPECLVTSSEADILHQSTPIPATVITGVTTSLIARKQKLASRLTAEKIAIDTINGAHVATLGIFEQGYYDLLGFGTGCYEQIVEFSPSSLNIRISPGIPTRLDKKDWKVIHKNRIKRLRTHGSINISKEISQAETEWSKTGFGLGYFDSNNQLTHHMWITNSDAENGPYKIEWLAYKTGNQLLELLALIQSFGDQIKLIKMVEPPLIQIQDFIRKPFFHQSISKSSPYMNTIKSYAFWQTRICNMEACLNKTHFKSETFQFNLELYDPISAFLSPELKWNGLSGQYVITLGHESNAEKGNYKRLKTLKCDVNSFTRLWLGVRKASELQYCNRFSAPNSLISKLDNIINLPYPKPDWEY